MGPEMKFGVARGARERGGEGVRRAGEGACDGRPAGGCGGARAAAKACGGAKRVARGSGVKCRVEFDVVV